MSIVLTQREQRFGELFEQLIDSMTDNDHINIPHIEIILGDISKLLRLSKGVTRLYRNRHEEELGGGETLCSYDLKVDSVPVYSYRIETSVMSIGHITLYIKKGDEPLDDFEKAKVELVSKTLLTFLCRNRLKDIVKELALFDDSGFKNQRSLFNYLLETSARGTLGGRAGIHYNLRHFSLVNQQIGRNAGDTVMHKHFMGLERLIGDRGIVTRLGGDNFICVCGREQLEDVTDYLTETAVVYDEKDGSSVFVSTSAGVFVFPDVFTIKEPGEVLNFVFAASRAAQTGGKEHIVYYSDALVAGREKSMRVQQLFPRALENGEFHVYYQPKVDVNTGEIVGAEALSRWVRDGKVIPPIDFIPMLEETNDICKLDMYVLAKVCEDIKRWLAEGRNVVRVSVNLSRKNMMNAGLLEKIMGIIGASGVPHRLIEIELTETTTDVEFKDLKRVVGGLQHEGVSASVDDFGIGYSSLNLIKVIPWNVLKVDRSFLPSEDEGTSFVMFKYVIAMAKEMGLQCIAEGVETQAQLSVLKESGCNIAQGFLFDKPLPVEEFEKRLDMQRYTF